MSDRKKNEDQEFNDTLKRMLKSPPKPHSKESLTESDHDDKRSGDSRQPSSN